MRALRRHPPVRRDLPRLLAIGQPGTHRTDAGLADDPGKLFLRQFAVRGDGGAAREAEKRGIELLGEIPLSMAVRTGSDSGTPIVVAEPHSEQAKTYRAIAKRLIEVAKLRNEESE